jgi:hypothetical protein
MYLTESELAAELEKRPGLIPTAIDAVGRGITWVDWDGYHFYEGFFADSLNIYAGLRGSEPTSFISSLECLVSPAILSPEIGSGCMQPAGFIFHAGRSGSRLLAKSLARSRQHLVFMEASPHNQIWHRLAADGDGGIGMYRNLLTLMGRRRLPSYTAHLVKFTSFNIIEYGFIRRAFPGVPALFLFRDPGSIVESYRRQPPGWLSKDLGIGKTWDTAEAAVEDYFRAALSIDEAGFHCLDYQDLSAQALPAILRFFHLHPAPAELRLMESEFAWDARSFAPRAFDPESRAPSGPVPDSLRDLYTQLGRRARATLQDEPAFRS